MSLSFSTTSMSASTPPCVTPALFSASKAMPALIAPSPMMATALRLLALQLGGQRHAQRGRDRGRRMRGAEGVVLAFVAARKAADAAELAQRVHALAPAGQDLVRVGLVAHVPDQPVVRRVEDVVQRDRQLDRAQVARQVAAGLATRFAARSRATRRPAPSARRATGAAGRPGCRCRQAKRWWSWRPWVSCLGRPPCRPAALSRAASARPLRGQRRLGLVAQLVRRGGARRPGPARET